MNKLIPILYQPEMSKAILENRKWVTRRLVKVKGCKPFYPDTAMTLEEIMRWNKNYHPYGQAGDILWVREKFYAYGKWVKNGKTKTGKDKWKFVDMTVKQGLSYQYYRKYYGTLKTRTKVDWYKRNSLFMPFEACRTFLKVTAARIERLQEISAKQALGEGIELVYKEYDVFPMYKDYRSSKFVYDNEIESYRSLWESINGPDSWRTNPFVWVIEFSKTEKPNTL